MERIADRLARAGLVALLALALVLVGFGHRMALTGPVDLAAYAMPDGTLPVLCLEGGAETGKTDRAPSCPACTLAAAILLPAAVVLPAVQLATSQADWPAPATAVAEAHQPRAPPARGPPGLSLI